MSSVTRVAAAASFDAKVVLSRSLSSLKRLSISPETPLPGTEAYNSALRNLKNAQKTKSIAEETFVRTPHAQVVDRKDIGPILEELDTLSLQVQKLREHIAALGKISHSPPN